MTLPKNKKCVTEFGTYRMAKRTKEQQARFKKPAEKKPRKRIKARSDSLRARALRELYEEAKTDVLKKQPKCLLCWRKSSEVHHRRGRTGTLLIDDRFLSATCWNCHASIHAFPRTAKENGWMAGAGEWNTPPKDERTAELNGLILDRINAIGERIKKRTEAKLCPATIRNTRKTGKQSGSKS